MNKILNGNKKNYLSDLFFKKIKYSSILKENREFEDSKHEKAFRILITSNIINFHLKSVLSYVLRKLNISSDIINGEYNNIIQDSYNYQNEDCIIVFWDIINFNDNFIEDISKFSVKKFDEFLNAKKEELDQLLNNLEKIPLVLFNKFTCNHHQIDSNKLEYINTLTEELNKKLSDSKNHNLQIISLDTILCKERLDDHVNLETFYNSKILYTLNFYWEYINQIIPYIISANGKARKVLILDCDNTLWHGILGEDGFENIKMSRNDKIGIYFHRIQKKICELSSQGVLIALCSKNNLNDVDKVINDHKDFIIKNENIILKEVNWNNKVDNIQNISAKLNLGLDSFVFIDDSEFEIRLVNEYLPEVKTIKVPNDLSKFPELLDDVARLFYQLSRSKEDSNKAASYRQRAQRLDYKNKFENVDDYLRSLKQKIYIEIDKVEYSERLSQLTQKTNQFNLNKNILTHQQMINICNDRKYLIFSLNHNDKFGDSGITGLAIVNLTKNYPCIEQFLMSCRIIGRKVEESFLYFIVNFLKKQKFEKITSVLTRTEKNIPVTNFYEKNQFLPYDEKNGTTYYEYRVKNNNFHEDNIVEIIYVKNN